ncbi:MAG TPA: polysaccharide deacetylase family protein [Kofleriaceae bacterium]|nr:polysaccharide deacetylase family protein [Kofleriaceae bacterium]
MWRGATTAAGRSLQCVLAAAVGVVSIAGLDAVGAQPESLDPAGAKKKKKKHWPKPAAGPTSSGGPEIILTFDDGPHEKYTRRILDALAAHKAQAIFYWVGRRVLRDRPVDRVRKALVARAVREGHLVGNHTVHHVQLCQGELREAEREIDHNQELLEAHAGMPVVLFRVPYGAYCKRLKRMLAARQLEHLHWDIDPQEYNGLSSVGTAEHVIGRLKNLDGRAVLLMHDTHGVSARALPIILDWIDRENRRRRRTGERPIRIVSGAELVEERMASELWSWGADTARSAEARLGQALGGLIPGRASPAAVAQRGGAEDVAARP